MTFVYCWFGIGLFVATMTFIQWIFDGRPIHAERNDGMEGTWNDYYYLKGMLFNVFFHFLLGPIILGIQWGTRMPIFPRKN